MKTFFPLPDVQSVLPILWDVALWGGVAENQRQKIFDRLEVGFYRQGEHIFCRGDEPSHIYIVKKGRVNLRIQDEGIDIEKKILSVGECFGEASLIAMQKHTATAVAIEDSEIMVLSRQALLDLQRDDLKLFALLMMNVARELARRLRLTDEILFYHVKKQHDAQPWLPPDGSS